MGENESCKREEYHEKRWLLDNDEEKEETEKHVGIEEADINNIVTWKKDDNYKQKWKEI